MSRYIFTAKINPEEKYQGIIEADSPQEAISRLSQSGYFPVSVKAEDNQNSEKDMFFRWRVSPKEIAAFTRQLSSLIYSGVPILRSLDILVNQIGNKYFRAVLLDVKGKVRDGKPLSQSLASHPLLFQPIYVSMVNSGEISGTLDKSLKRLSEFLDQEQELKDVVLAAITYPVFVMAVGLMTIVVLVMFVIPKLAAMFTDMNEGLPLPTLILINISNFIQKYTIAIFIALGAAVFAAVRFYKSPNGKFFLDNLKIKLFFCKNLVIKTEISRLSRTLSLLLSSGVPVLYSIDLAASVIRNNVINQEVKNFRTKIIKGQSFSKCLSESKIFPEYVVSVAAVGEETGTLEHSLLAISEEYEKDVERQLRVLTRLLEPLIILSMGLVVGFIVLAMLLPVFQMNMMMQ